MNHELTVDKAKRRFLLRVGACFLACAVAGATSGARGKEKDDDLPEQGSTPQEIAALKARPLPQPNTIKVAVLAFHDISGSLAHVRMASAANFLLWQREGFSLLPLSTTFAAQAADKELEPGLPLRRSDAVRLGKALGARYVVYGEVKELRHYVKRGAFKQGKYLIAGVRIAVADVESGEMLYWHERSDKTGGTGGSINRKADTLKRRGAIIASMNALKPFFEVLPMHETQGKVPDSGDLATFINQTWPGDEHTT